MDVNTDVGVAIQMPAMRPIPIPTRNVFFLVAIWRWITVIRRWKLIEDWHHTLPDGTSTMVPKGFDYDGASIPKLFWAVLSPTGLLLIPGLVHDFGYRFDFLLKRDESGQFEKYRAKAGRRYWDDVFRDIPCLYRPRSRRSRSGAIFLVC